MGRGHGVRAERCSHRLTGELAMGWKQWAAAAECFERAASVANGPSVTRAGTAGMGHFAGGQAAHRQFPVAAVHAHCSRSPAPAANPSLAHATELPELPGPAAALLHLLVTIMPPSALVEIAAGGHASGASMTPSSSTDGSQAAALHRPKSAKRRASEAALERRFSSSDLVAAAAASGDHAAKRLRHERPPVRVAACSDCCSGRAESDAGEGEQAAAWCAQDVALPPMDWAAVLQSVQHEGDMAYDRAAGCYLLPGACWLEGGIRTVPMWWLLLALPSEQGGSGCMLPTSPRGCRRCLQPPPHHESAPATAAPSAGGISVYLVTCASQLAGALGALRASMQVGDCCDGSASGGRSRCCDTCMHACMHASC